MIARLMHFSVARDELFAFGEPKSAWRYCLSVPYQYRSKLLEGVTYVDLRNPWVRIANGVITIQAGYAWDGCSPKLRHPLLGLAHLGVPDGPWHLGTNPTYHASLVHDALCQFRHAIPISKATAVALFDEMLAKSEWRYRRLYVWAVRRFGPKYFKGN